MIAARVALAFTALFVLAPATASAATLDVDSNADNATNDGSCTLREAVTAVNNNADVNGSDDCDHDSGTGLDTISLDATTTYTIAVTSDEGNNASGDFDINLNAGDVVIDGAGASSTTVDANDHDRVFEFTGTGTGTVQELTATDGTAPLVGGIIRGHGNTNVTVARASVTQGVATGSGGGGGIGFLGPGTLVVTDSLIDGNQVSGGPSAESELTGGGGILLLQGDGTLTVTRSTISNNSYTEPDDATNSVFHYGGGGIKINSSSGGSGNGNRATIDDSKISGNSVTTADPADGIAGGGIHVQNAEDSVFLHRTAVTGNTLTGGQSSFGGGIGYRDSGASLIIVNTTVSGNSATGSTAAEQGGGIGVFNGNTRLYFTTVTNNTADSGLGLFFHGGAADSFAVRSSIVSETSSACEEPGAEDIESNDYNVDRGATCHFTDGNDAENTNPNLAGLADNGGPTQTHAIVSTSAAHDRVNDALSCQDGDGEVATDQRGAPRPLTPHMCDSGAYELVECMGVTVTRVGTEGDDTLVGTAGPDGMLGFGGADIFNPGDGGDRVCGGNGADFVLETADGDTNQYLGDAGSDTVSLQNLPAGTYSATVGSGTGVVGGTGVGTHLLSSVENAFGSTSPDTLTANAENVANLLVGLGGDDVLESRGGNDELIGSSNGAAGDTVVFDEAPGAVSVDLTNAAAQNTGDGNDTIATVENVTGSPAGDTLIGDGAANLLSGIGGDDTLEGRAANDILTGGAHGAAGDTVVFDEAPGPVSVDLSNAAAQNTGDGSDTITTTENLTGSPSGDILTGTTAANNVLSGLGGDDTLEGRAANDVLTGGAHGAAGDTVVFDEAAGPVSVNLANAAAQNTGDGTDTITTTENVTGSPSADTLTGDGAANRLTGLGAGDTITGALGADQLFGNAGADNMFARDGIGDTVDCGTPLTDTVETDAAGVDTLIDCENSLFPAVPPVISPVTPTVSALSATCAGKTVTQAGGPGPAVISGSEGPDVITGTSGPDVIAGLGGTDTIRGLGANDLICGGNGKDNLIGGAGKDRLLGEGGKDKLKGGGGRDTCAGGGGRDTGASCEKQRSVP